MALTVFATPMLGYANNYDFLRQSSCTGLWQSYPDREKTAINKKQSVNALHYDGQTDAALCLYSSDNLFAWAALQSREKGERLRYQDVAVWKMLLVACMGALALWYASGGTRLALSVFYYLVVGDIANLAYFNTLYLEVSVIIGTLLAIVGTVWLMTIPRRPARHMLLFSGFGVLWLGFAKLQYHPLAVVFLTLYAVILLVRWRWVAGTGYFLTLSVLTMVGFADLHGGSPAQTDGMRLVNNTNTYFYAVLPAVHDKARALKQLGLPPHCRADIGKHWYYPEMQRNHPCPEIAQVSRWKLVKLFFSQPRSFYIPLLESIIRVHPFYPSHLAFIEQNGSPPGLVHALVERFSFTRLLAWMPVSAYNALIAIWFVLAAYLGGKALFGSGIGNRKRCTCVRR